MPLLPAKHLTSSAYTIVVQVLTHPVASVTVIVIVASAIKVRLTAYDDPAATFVSVDTGAKVARPGLDGQVLLIVVPPVTLHLSSPASFIKLHFRGRFIVIDIL